ncbi:MAG: SUMF1/EgtB/PvdO family nonheme iron enzyme [Phycisphaerae bacterium]|nr:SUMF1/EgtB/PvdO family nonheme iron enzyme [Phycisphaerae bacterium]
MNLFRRPLLIGMFAGLLAPTASTAVNVETVPVGNPGNLGELSGQGAGGYGSDRICGGVDYVYSIGKHEVTAGQYCEFLNAVAAIDTHGLYHAYMDYDAHSNGRGCNIKRTGSSGNYTYSVAADWSNRPVNYVDWGDAARFANWLHNGQPTGVQGLGTTEDGAYFLNGATSDAELMAVMREPGAVWALPSEDEWYKAAYYRSGSGVPGSDYWDYPTSSDSVPGNLATNPDPGNNANFDQDGPAIGAPYWRTEAGEFENSDSPYGTFDQGGNVWEWNEAILDGSYRGLRGGSFAYDGDSLRASDRYLGGSPWIDSNDVGFRVVQVPEPLTIMLLALAGGGMLRRSRS